MRDKRFTIDERWCKAGGRSFLVCESVLAKPGVGKWLVGVKCLN